MDIFGIRFGKRLKPLDLTEKQRLWEYTRRAADRNGGQTEDGVMGMRLYVLKIIDLRNRGYDVRDYAERERDFRRKLGRAITS